MIVTHVVTLPHAWGSVAARCVYMTLKSSQVHCLYINNRPQPKEEPLLVEPLSIECAPEASCGGREWAEMTEGIHLEVTRHTRVPTRADILSEYTRFTRCSLGLYTVLVFERERRSRTESGYIPTPCQRIVTSGGVSARWDREISQSVLLACLLSCLLQSVIRNTLLQVREAIIARGDPDAKGRVQLVTQRKC